jgi:MFS family permease
MQTRFTGLPREVQVLVVVAFFVALGFGILVPAIPLFARSFGASNFLAGMVVAVFAGARLVTAPIWGRLVAPVGERTIMTVGISLVAFSSFLAGFSQDIWQLIVLRGFGGVGSAMFTVSAFSLLIRVSDPDQRGRASAAFQGGFLLGSLAGPAVGVPLVQWSLRAPFFFYAGTLAVAAAVALVALRGAKLTVRAEGDREHDLREALRNRSYVSALVNSFVSGWAQSGVRSLLLPLLVVYGIGAEPAWVAAGIFISAVVQWLALGRAGTLSDERGRKLPLLVGEVLALFAMLAIAAFETLPVFLVMMAVFGVSGALIGSSSAAVVGDVVQGRGGTSVAAYQMSSDAAVLVAPLVLGAITVNDQYTAGLLLSAAVTAVGILFVATMPETRRRSAPSEPAPVTPSET